MRTFRKCKIEDAFLLPQYNARREVLIDSSSKVGLRHLATLIFMARCLKDWCYLRVYQYIFSLAAQDIRKCAFQCDDLNSVRLSSFVEILVFPMYIWRETMDL